MQWANSLKRVTKKEIVSSESEQRSMCGNFRSPAGTRRPHQCVKSEVGSKTSST